MLIRWSIFSARRRRHLFLSLKNFYCHAVNAELALSHEMGNSFLLFGNEYRTDQWTNIKPHILRLLQRRLHQVQYNPLCLIKQRITDYFYQNYRKPSSGSPLFAVQENLSPVVTVWQNFDSLLVPLNHPSRRTSDTYYLNKDYVLRSHTSAHEHDLIAAGLDCFLTFGDVYRRDEIDRCHYPCFHQLEGVRLFSARELFQRNEHLSLFDLNPSAMRTNQKQALLSNDAAAILEIILKSTLEGLARNLFGSAAQMRWVDTYFPFTHPSWELEVLYEDNWIEMLGCGILEQQILENAGAGSKVGWAFGAGLERLAMRLYKIPDIRLFWSQDSGVLHQFKIDDFRQNVEYVPISKFPQCINDMSFWLDVDNRDGSFPESDFLDLVRHIGEDMVEQVEQIDRFQHPKTGRHSRCYRIIYRSMERTLTKDEVNVIHKQIERDAAEKFKLECR